MHSSVSERQAHIGGDTAIPDVVADFLNRLRRLPVGEWARVATHAERPHDTGALALPRADASEAAHARLRKIVARTPALAAQTQQRILDLIEVAQGFSEVRSPAAMRHVALGAALALATREELGEAAFGELYAPFATLIPLRPRAELLEYVETTAA